MQHVFVLSLKVKIFCLNDIYNILHKGFVGMISGISLKKS